MVTYNILTQSSDLSILKNRKQWDTISKSMRWNRQKLKWHTILPYGICLCQELSTIKTTFGIVINSIAKLSTIPWKITKMPAFLNKSIKQALSKETNLHIKKYSKVLAPSEKRTTKILKIDNFLLKAFLTIKRN